MLSKESHEEILKGYVHETARRAIAENALAFVAEQRKVVVAFAKIEGLKPALMAGAAGLVVLQQCLEVALTCIQVRRSAFSRPLMLPGLRLASPFWLLFEASFVNASVALGPLLMMVA